MIFFYEWGSYAIDLSGIYDIFGVATCIPYLYFLSFLSVGSAVADYFQFIFAFSLYTMSMFGTPGPNNAVMLAVGITHGYKATVPHLIAIELSAVTMILTMGAGLSEIFIRFPLLFQLLKVFGTCYLIWLAGRIVGIDIIAQIKRLFPVTSRQETEKKSSDNAIEPLSFTQGLLFQLSNVKAWITSIVAISSYAGSDENTWTRIWIMVAIYLIVGTPSGLIWGLGGEFMGKFLTGESIRRINYVFALFLLLSIVLIFI